MLAFSQTPWMLPFTGLLLPLASLILGVSKQQRAFASPRVPLLDLGIKIPVAPAQVRVSAGPQVQPWAVSSATLCLWSMISIMAFPSSHPHWLWCARSVSFHVSLSSSRLFVLMLFKEEIKSFKKAVILSVGKLNSDF